MPLYCQCFSATLRPARSWSLREAFFLPGRCAAARRLLAPARGAPRLLRLRPSRDVSRRGPSLFVRRHASDTPPRDARSVTRSRRRHGRWHPPGGLKAPLPESGGPNPHSHLPVLARPLKQAPGEREGDGEDRPAGDRSHCAEACGPRAARMAGGNAGPDRASHAREGNSEGPHAGLCLLGRTRRRVGGLRSMRSPSDRSESAGQQEASRSENRVASPRTRVAKEKPSRREKRRNSARGARKASRSERSKKGVWGEAPTKAPARRPSARPRPGGGAA